MKHTILLLLFGNMALITSIVLVKGERAKPAASPETKIATLLDKFVQPRFLQDAGKFGIERLVIAGHEDQAVHSTEAVYRLKANTLEEKKLLRAANSAKRNYAIGFVHCPHKLGKFLPQSKTNSGAVSESISSESGFQTLVVHERGKNLYFVPDGVDTETWENHHLIFVNRLVKKERSRLLRGEQVDVKTDRLFLALRPIKASQTSCLSCHRGTKKGDVLGIMAYAVTTK